MDFHWWCFVHRFFFYPVFLFCIFSRSISIFLPPFYLCLPFTILCLRLHYFQFAVLPSIPSWCTDILNILLKSIQERYDASKPAWKFDQQSHRIEGNELNSNKVQKAGIQKKSIWKLLHKMDGEIRTKEAQLMEMLMARAENNKME